MSTMKKLFLYLIVLLFIMAVYKDLTIGIGPVHPIKDSALSFTAVQVMVEEDDTVLSIIRKVNNNQQLTTIKDKMAINDFKILNPHVNPRNLKRNMYYYFPLYTQK
ncbi:hypothetical protein [Virgibacillus sp. SK37]|uniref:hypothetical protein n=1 Tax=Virgibacillus sp. SK37 TaxID=403957 RepID=UPI0004D0DC21|nr:hypothetical protein [Virgibacillus sp. SK37]AIF45390.1 hypothetical protein X953_09775 [Virgibacillus sp. SK37]